MSGLTDDEAIAICEGWFAYLQRQKDKARKMSELAAMARSGQQEEAQRQMRQMDRQPTVYDGGRLEPAVRHLVKRLRGKDAYDGLRDAVVCPECKEKAQIRMDGQDVCLHCGSAGEPA